MSVQTSFLPNFSHLLQGKPKPSPASVLAKGIDHLRHLSLPDLSALLGSFFPQEFFSNAPDSKPQREAIYTPTTLFWAFLFQVLNPGMACQDVVAKVRAWLVERPLNSKRPSLGTAAFCQAHCALSLKFVQAAGEALRSKLTVQAPSTWLWCGHAVKVLDGTSVSMPDTAANQLQWPQPPAQKPGCGLHAGRLLPRHGSLRAYPVNSWNE